MRSYLPVSMLLVITAAAIAAVVLAEAPASRAGETAAPVAVVVPRDASWTEQLAAKDVRRYVYLRTGQLLPLLTADLASLEDLPPGGLITVGHQHRFDKWLAGQPELGNLLREGGSKSVLKTIEHQGRKVLVVSGAGSNLLYAAYRLAEHLGVRFYLHGDVVPDSRIRLSMPVLAEARTPLFAHRGIQPFHDFPEGPDWWSLDDYKAILAQLPKLGMNFFGLHTYPQGGVGPEPLVWIGLADDILPDGRVKFSYPARHFVTMNVTGAWGYRPMRTSDYLLGASGLFDRDDFGAEYMRDTHPWNKMTVEQSNELFNRMGQLLRDAFGFAERLGVDTCIGTETPLVIPREVQQRLKAAGKNPADPAVVQEVYQGIFERIKRTHPLKYYWLWTPEDWTWQAVSQQKIDATLADFRAVLAAAEKVQPPFTLATCGWVLGPQQDRALFDNFLPKNMPMSCINREVGHAPVEPGFEKVTGRPKWAIPWLEDDPAMIVPQLWVGRMRKDAVDARKYGCTGLMGIHWRTRILGPNVSALAKAAWEQSAFATAATTAAQKLPEGPEGGNYAAFPNNKIEATADQTVYQTVRWDVAAYRLDVPNGKYSVTLKFCEPHYNQPQKRVFGVKLQGKTVIESLDVFAKVGKNKALDYTFPDIEVRDGQLTIEFLYIVEYPCIAAIVVQGDRVTRKINCGGPAYNDYAADWPASARTAKYRQRYLPSEDFYLDWATAEFGPKAAQPAAKLLAQLDGHLPQPATWVGGPGGINPDSTPWEQVARQYEFVEQFAKLHPLVASAGPGHLERFEYWLANFRYLRALGKMRCTWAQYNETIKTLKAEKDPDAQKKLARQLALPLRKQLVAEVAQLHNYLMQTVSTWGELGTVANWQQHNLPGLLIATGEELSKLLGEPLPADAMPPRHYQGPPRLIVPTVRSLLESGEPLRLRAMVLRSSAERTADATRSAAEAQADPAPVLCWRPLGAGEYLRVPMQHLARGVYQSSLPAEKITGDIEYYIEVSVDGSKLYFPPTAPAIAQTVVVIGQK